MKMLIEKYILYWQYNVEKSIHIYKILSTYFTNK